MAGLCKRGKQGVWHITYRDERGVPRKKSTGCTDKSKAESVKRQFEDEQRLGIIDPYYQHRKRSLEAHIADYYEYQLAKGYDLQHVGTVRSQITRLFDLAGTTKLDAINEADVRITLTKLRQVTRSPKHKAEEMPLLAVRTRNAYLSAARSFCRWLHRNKRLPDNPLSALEAENEATDVRHARTAYTDEEFRALYNAALNSSKRVECLDGPTRAMMYLVAVSTGLRRRELGSLTPQSFRLGERDPMAIVEASFSKRRRRDKVRIAKFTLPTLRPWLATIPEGEEVFPRLADRKTSKMVKHDLKTAGIEYQNPAGEYRDLHALRHTYITRAWMSGAQPNVVQDLARHSDIRVTMGYSHTSGADLRRAVDSIPEILLDVDEQEGVA